MYRKIEKIGLLAAFLLSTFAFAEDLVVQTWNVNNDRRVDVLHKEDGTTVPGFATASHENWKFENRAPRIYQQIHARNADVLLLQEMDLVSAKMMKDELEAAGYTAIIQPYNETMGAFRLVTAFKTQRFEIEASAARYLSKHPERPTKRPSNYDALTKDQKQPYFDENFGEEFERVAHFFKVKDLQNGKSLFFYNTHFGLRKDSRIKSAELLASLFNEFITDNGGSIASPAMGGGDYNAFPDVGGSEQMAIIFNSFPNLSANARIFDGQNVGEHAPGTFCFYPFDLGLLPEPERKGVFSELDATPDIIAKRDIINRKAAERTALGGTLDFIVGRNVEVLESTVVADPTVISDTSLESFNLAEAPQSEIGIKLSDFVNKMNAKNVPAFPSDHFSVVMKVRY